MKKLILFAFLGTLLLEGGLLAETQVPGGEHYGTWDLAGSPYILNGSITVPSGETLTIESEVEVQTHSSLYNIYIDGHLQASDPNFTGSFTEIRVNSGGVLDLTNPTVENGSVLFYDGSGGSINGGDCGAYVKILGSSSPIISNVTFTSSSPIYCPAEYFPEITDNTFDSANDATIYIQGGTVNQDMTWGVMGSVNQYRIDADVTVAVGSTLTVGPDAQLTVYRDCDLIIDGSLIVSSGSRLYIYYSSSLTVNGSATITNAEWVKLFGLYTTYGGTSSFIYVNGDLTLTNTPVAYDNDKRYTYIFVSSGGSLTVEDCNHIEVGNLYIYDGASFTCTNTYLLNNSQTISGTFSITGSDIQGGTLTFNSTASGTFNQSGRDMASTHVTIYSADVTINNCTLGGTHPPFSEPPDMLGFPLTEREIYEEEAF